MSVRSGPFDALCRVFCWVVGVIVVVAELVDGDCVALIDALAPALVVLVADAELGTINLVRLSLDALRGHRVVVYLNRFDDGSDVHARNARWLQTREGLEVVTDIEALATLVEPIVR